MRGPAPGPGPGISPGAPRAPLHRGAAHSCAAPPRTFARRRRGTERNERNVVVSPPIQIPDASAPSPRPTTPLPDLDPCPASQPPPFLPLGRHRSRPGPRPRRSHPLRPRPRPSRCWTSSRPSARIPPPGRCGGSGPGWRRRSTTPGRLGGYIAVLSKVVGGTLSREQLLAAYKAGLQSVGRADRPALYFNTRLRTILRRHCPAKFGIISSPRRPRLPSRRPRLNCGGSSICSPGRASSPRRPCNGCTNCGSWGSICRPSNRAPPCPALPRPALPVVRIPRGPHTARYPAGV